jgi:hypothetical protein
MEPILVKCSLITPQSKKSVKIQTTLYELMEAVIDVVGPDNNRMVKDVTLNILAKTRPKIRVTDH